MADATTTGTNILTQVKNVVGPIVDFINAGLTQLIPGHEEWVVVAIALYLGWKYKERQYLSGGYELWAKASVVIYIILKILGLGIKLI